MNKKAAALFCCAALMTSLLAGCGGTGKADKALYGKAQNEIASYDRTDEKKTQLVIGVVENDELEKLAAAFAEKYQDVQPVIRYLQKGDTDYSPAKEWIKKGYAPDVVYNVDFGADNGSYLEDLSGSEAVGSYYDEALEANDDNGSIYVLPGPAKVMAVAYNKTLFEKYGWTVPKTFDEFLSLCDKIKADTSGSVEPYNPNGKYATDFTGGMEAFAYGELFGGTENRSWYKAVLRGEGDFAGHMEPYFSMIEKMAEHGAVTADDFDYSYTTRTKNFLAGKIAMVNIFTDLDTTNDGGFEFGYFPFPSTDGKPQYLSTRQSFNLSVVKKTRTKEQQKAVDEYLRFVSTPEAQKICMGDSIMLSSVKGTQTGSGGALEGIKKWIDEGMYFKRLDFSGYAVPDTFNTLEAMVGEIEKVTDGAESAKDAAKAVGSAIASAIKKAPAAAESKVAGKASADFTVLETSFFAADAMKDRTGADIALIPNNSVYRGNIQRFFAGDITREMLDDIVPRSIDSKAKLVKVSMTGADILKALNAPPDFNGGTANCIYAFSGLKVKAAPWNDKGSKYLSVTLSDGSALSAEKTYAVATWQGMIDDGYIKDTQSTYDDTYSDVLFTAISKAGTIDPADDGRITLVWQ